MKKILAFALALAMILTCSLALADRLDDIKAAGKLTRIGRRMSISTTTATSSAPISSCASGWLNSLALSWRFSRWRLTPALRLLARATWT